MRASAGLAGALLLTMAGCGGKAPAGVESKPASNPLEIAPGPELQRQIKVGRPRWDQVSATLTVPGRVEVDETRIARVSAPVTGRIVEMEVFEGQPVKRGQVLATIHSTELSSGQAEFLKARSQRQLAERAVSRARQLLEAGVIGEAELQRREAELQEANADLSSSRHHLGVLGLSEEAIRKLEASHAVNSVTHLLSSIDGVVFERKATIGQSVQAVETVFVVADLSSVWLVADVPEQSTRSLHAGKRVEAEIPALPGERIAGVLSYVSAVVNPETRTVRARMQLPNPDRRFKPAMLATMAIVDSAERKLVVPAVAIVREENQDHVLCQTGPNKYTLRRVTLGEDHRETRVVLEGIGEKDAIVTEGAFHLNNERKRLMLQAGSGS